MPAAIPFLSTDSDQGGLFYGADQSTSGSPIESVARAPMNDYGITGAVPVDVSGQAGGRANISVAVLVLIALGGMIAFHYLGFRALVDVSVGRS